MYHDICVTLVTCVLFATFVFCVGFVIFVLFAILYYWTSVLACWKAKQVLAAMLKKQILFTEILIEIKKYVVSLSKIEDKRC